MSEKRKRKSVNSYHHGDLKPAAIGAAVNLIKTRKEVTFTLREIASEISVSHVALYRHFSNKRMLLAAIAEEGYKELLKALKGRQNLNDHVEAYVGFALANPSHFRAMYHADLSDRSDLPELAALAAQAGDCLISAAKRSQEAHALRSDVTSQTIALAFWALAHGLADLILSEQFQEARQSNKAIIMERVEAITKLMFEGVGERSKGS